MLFSWFQIFICLAAGILLARFELWYLTLPIFIYGLLGKNYARHALIASLILLTGFIYYNCFMLKPPAELTHYKNASVSGTVKTYPGFDGTRSKFILEGEHSNPYQQNIMVFCNFAPEVNKGDKVRICGTLKPPEQPGNPGEFDYKAYLALDKIYYTLSVKKESDLKVLVRQEGVQGWINSYRLQGEKTIHNFLPEEEASILLGMLIGKKEGIEPDQYSDFQKTGIVHIFAVSGLHVGYILLLAAGLSSLLGFSQRLKFFFGIFLLLLYGTLVGWPISVVRASIMASTGLFAYYIGRDNQLINSLGLAGIIILLLDPYALFKISFQLSFLATWGLVYLFPLIKSRLSYNNRFWDIVLIPLCAQIAVMPFIAYYFNLLTPVALFSNILISYLAGIPVILGFLCLIFAGLLPFISNILLYPAGFIIEIIITLTNFFKGFPASYIWVATPGLLMMLMYYTGLILVIIGLKSSESKYFMGSGIMLISLFIAILCLPAGIYNRGVLEVVFIDVGQGDSTLLKTPGGKFLLIDGGGSDFYDVGARKLLPYLHHRGIRELFMVINTHPDTDHLQGLEKVVAELPVKCISLPASLVGADEYSNLKQAAQGRNIPLVPLQSGQELSIEKGLEMRVIYPDTDKYAGRDYNEQSLVLDTRMGNFSILLTGDATTESLQKILNARTVKPVTIVKVPHHGSKGSLLPEFYKKANPLYAVISSGKNNPFGHPHQSVLDMLEQNQIKILRTDLQGAITVETDGKGLKITTNS